MQFFKLGKTHVPHYKNTEAMPAVRMDIPTTVRIPVLQHIGAPAVIAVNVGDKVSVGTVIAQAGGYVSAPVHSSVSGSVKKIEEMLTSQGKKIPVVVIESDGAMTPDADIKPPVIDSLDALCDAVRASGLVGLGGAGFPTAVKLDAAKRGGIDTLVINAAECEPYITSDTRTMLDDAEYVKAGVELLCSYIPFESVHIGIEDNKPECIAKLKEIFSDNGKVIIDVLPSLYPQGGEKILIFNTTGRAVPEGKLPSDVGCIVMNVTSVAFVARYAKSGMPLVEKRITVDGSALKNSMNVIAPIGTAIEDVIAFAGGYSETPGKILYGGPMMGVAVYSPCDPIMKNTNAITVLNVKDAKAGKQHPCIHCGRCVSACPMGLIPPAFARAMNSDSPSDRAERLTDGHINLCIECGCCSFVCPSKRPLVETNRLAKADLREYNANKTEK